MIKEIEDKKLKRTLEEFFKRYFSRDYETFVKCRITKMLLNENTFFDLLKKRYTIKDILKNKVEEKELVEIARKIVLEDPSTIEDFIENHLNFYKENDYIVYESILRRLPKKECTKILDLKESLDKMGIRNEFVTKNGGFLMTTKIPGKTNFVFEQSDEKENFEMVGGWKIEESLFHERKVLPNDEIIKRILYCIENKTMVYSERR